MHFVCVQWLSHIQAILIADDTSDHRQPQQHTVITNQSRGTYDAFSTAAS